MFTPADFEALPKPARGWAWELVQPGRLRLTHTPVTVWHYRIMRTTLGYWLELGHEVAGDQYVADSGFACGGEGQNILVANGVVFATGHRPETNRSTHAATDIQAVIEAVSQDSEDHDAIEKLSLYARLGIPQYWIVRGDAGAETVDGLITMYELSEGEYKLVGQRLASQLERREG